MKAFNNIVRFVRPVVLSELDRFVLDLWSDEPLEQKLTSAQIVEVIKFSKIVLLREVWHNPTSVVRVYASNKLRFEVFDDSTVFVSELPTESMADELDEAPLFVGEYNGDEAMQIAVALGRWCRASLKF